MELAGGENDAVAAVALVLATLSTAAGVEASLEMVTGSLLLD
jgi:hypothetical protein